jgi:hypothetical protein
MKRLSKQEIDELDARLAHLMTEDGLDSNEANELAYELTTALYREQRRRDVKDRKAFWRSEMSENLGRTHTKIGWCDCRADWAFAHVAMQLEEQGFCETSVRVILYQLYWAAVHWHTVSLPIAEKHNEGQVA